MIKVEFWHAVAACINFCVTAIGAYRLSVGDTNTNVLAMIFFSIAGFAWLIAGAVKVAVEEEDE